MACRLARCCWQGSAGAGMFAACRPRFWSSMRASGARQGQHRSRRTYPLRHAAARARAWRSTADTCLRAAHAHGVAGSGVTLLPSAACPACMLPECTPLSLSLSNLPPPPPLLVRSLHRARPRFLSHTPVCLETKAASGSLEGHSAEEAHKVFCKSCLRQRAPRDGYQESVATSGGCQ